MAATGSPRESLRASPGSGMSPSVRRGGGRLRVRGDGHGDGSLSVRRVGEIGDQDGHRDGELAILAESVASVSTVGG